MPSPQTPNGQSLPTEPVVVSPLDALAAEVAADVGRIERELRLQSSLVLAEIREEMANLRAERAESQMHIAARLAGLKDGPQGPPGERGERGEGIQGPAGEQGPPGPPGAAAEAPPTPELYAPDDLAPVIGKAISLLAEAPVITTPQLPPVVNVTLPSPQPRTERTRVVKHDDKGRILEIERDVA